MSFVHPMFLWALALGMIPVLIYYLIRFRSLPVEWGAVYVLQRALNRLRRRNLEQLLLLALRVAIVLLLVVLFARPVSRNRAPAAAGGGTHRIIVLDGSYSMLAGERGATAWDRALAATRALVGSWGRGERWSLYFIGRPPRWIVDDRVVEKPERSRALLDGLEPEECAASLSQALETVLSKSAGRDTEIYLVADDQAATWKDVERVKLPAGPAIRFFWLHPAGAGSANLAVTRLRLNHERVLVRHPCRAFVTVRNYGAAPVENAEIEVLVDGAFFSREAVSIQPGQEAVVAVDVTFEEPGSHGVAARLRKDILEFDNAAAAGVEVLPSLDVAVLRDPARAGKFESAAGFLDLAGKVMTRKAADDSPLFAGGPLNVRILEKVSDAAALGAADVVVVDGGTALTPRLAQALDGYVRGGGGLVLAADDTIDTALWNTLLGPAGLLPAPVRAIGREALGGERFRSLARSGFGGEALKALETAEDGDVARSRLYSWADLGNPEADAAVLATFGDGRPFAVSRRRGSGTVVLLAAGLSSRNNNLLVREFTYPLLLNLLSAAAANGQPRTVATGEPVRWLWKGPDGPTAAQFSLGNQPPAVLTARPAAGGTLFELAAGSDRSGLGSVLLTWKDRHRRVWFGIQGERSDSDLTPLDPAARRLAVEHLGLTEASGWEELKARLEAGYRGAEWHHWAALILLAALAGEMAMQRRFV
jgi:hypothetical protein